MEPRLTFHGAARAVTGSCFRLETSGGQVLFDCGLTGARRVAEAPAPRIGPEQVARLDWHNDVSRLFLDINDALAGAADERARDALIRRLRRALEDGRERAPHR